MNVSTRTLSILAVGLVILAAIAIYWKESRTPARSDTRSGASAKAVPGQGADAAAIHIAMIGTWRSVEDLSFERRFSDDGTVTDTYTDEPTATKVGTWSLFTASNVDPTFTFPVASDTTYLKIVFDNEIYFYSVNTVLGGTLQLTYLDRGNTLSFNRVP